MGGRTRLRLGLYIEYKGKNYDILELPVEAFIQLIPGMTYEQYDDIDAYFHDFWPEPTIRRHHILGFAAEQLGTSIDFLMLNQRDIHFTDNDIFSYIEQHTKQGYRPS